MVKPVPQLLLSSDIVIAGLFVTITILLFVRRPKLFVSNHVNETANIQYFEYSRCSTRFLVDRRRDDDLRDNVEKWLAEITVYDNTTGRGDRQRRTCNRTDSSRPKMRQAYWSVCSVHWPLCACASSFYGGGGVAVVKTGVPARDAPCRRQPLPRY